MQVFTEKFLNFYKKKFLFSIKSEVFLKKEYLAPKTPFLLKTKRAKELIKLYFKAKEKKELNVDKRISGWMEYKEPQFFLKNISRLCKFEEDILPLEYKALAGERSENIIEEIRKMKYKPPEFLKKFAIEDVVWLRNFLKEVFFKTIWTDYFCRELKEKINIPLWKYNP